MFSAVLFPSPFGHPHCVFGRKPRPAITDHCGVKYTAVFAFTLVLGGPHGRVGACSKVKVFATLEPRG